MLSATESTSFTSARLLDRDQAVVDEAFIAFPSITMIGGVGPMVVFHGLVELIRPLIFQRENVEKHGVLPIDHAFGSKRFLRFFLV